MVRIAADENLHMVFYRDILGAALVLEPSAAVRAIVDEVLAFEMPGAGIPGFVRKAAADRQGGDLRPARPSRRGPAADPRHWRHLRADEPRRGSRGRAHRLAEHLASLDEAAQRFEERLRIEGVPRISSSGG